MSAVLSVDKKKLVVVVLSVVDKYSKVEVLSSRRTHASNRKNVGVLSIVLVFEVLALCRLSYGCRQMLIVLSASCRSS